MNTTFIHINKTNFFTIPKEINLKNIDFLVLKSIKSSKIWISKVYHNRYNNKIWISNKIKKREKFKILKKINLNKSKKINENIISIRIKDKIILFNPPKGSFYLIKEKIKLDKNLAWLIGFYLAEGNRKNKDGIGLSNKEIILLNKSMALFEKIFGINQSDWRIWIKTNQKNPKEIKRIKEKWNKKLGRNISIAYSKLAFEESIDIRINSRVLSSFLKYYFEYSLKKMIIDKNLAKQFLRGYVIGDGSVILRKKQIHGITITVKDKKHIEYLIKTFTLLYNQKPNIRKTKSSYELSYCKVDIITKIIMDGLFKDLNRQWNKLIKGYKNKQYTRARIKYWNKITNKYLNSYEIAKLSGNSHWAVSDALNKDEKKGLVNSQYLSNGGPIKKYYSLSPKGLQLFDTIGGRIK